MQKLLSALLVMVSCAAIAQESTPLFSISAPKDKTGHWTRISQFDPNKGAAFSPVYTAAGEELLAACAYDRRQNRLYFAPMNQNQLRYIDLANPNSPNTVFGPEILPGADMAQVGNQVTRMTIDGKGNGYALNNDGTHLVRFNTSGQWMVQDLGMISDAAANGGNSVHNPCLSWGGDIAADVSGNIFLVTGNHAVFYIDVASREASYRGLIKGLPNNYSTNGIAADEAGQLMVGSASSTEGYFLVNLQTLEATKMAGSANNTAHVADLASPFLVGQKKESPGRSLIKKPFTRNEAISIYPNPVIDGRFRINFSGFKNGRYDIQLFDLTGAIVSKQSITISNKVQTEQVDARGTVTKGIYLVKIIGKNARVFYADKLIVQ